jgi:hypothetical protein
MQKARLAEPFALLDQHLVHQRDLPSRAAKIDKANHDPHTQRSGKSYGFFGGGLGVGLRAQNIIQFVALDIEARKSCLWF